MIFILLLFLLQLSLGVPIGDMLLGDLLTVRVVTTKIVTITACNLEVMSGQVIFDKERDSSVSDYEDSMSNTVEFSETTDTPISSNEAEYFDDSFTTLSNVYGQDTGSTVTRTNEGDISESTSELELASSNSVSISSDKSESDTISSLLSEPASLDSSSVDSSHIESDVSITNTESLVIDSTSFGIEFSSSNGIDSTSPEGIVTISSGEKTSDDSVSSSIKMHDDIVSSSSSKSIYDMETSLSEITSDEISQASGISLEPATSSKNHVDKATKLTYNYGNSYFVTTKIIWERFWSNSKSQINANDQVCGQKYKEPSVWELAVVAKGMIELGDTFKTTHLLENLYKYQNDKLGVFSATTASDKDIYNDDNAQIAWCYLEGYKLTKDKKHLKTAETIMDFLQKETDENGGTIWKYKEDYIASISTIEAGLTALRLYEITKDSKLIEFGKKSLKFMFEYLQDPHDKLFYDGLNKNDYGDLNKGKLTYTVGCALSALSILYKHDESNSQEWLQKIVELADACTNEDGVFYNVDKVWNNQMKYIHLLYVGFANIFQLDQDFTNYKLEVTRQANYIQEYLKDPLDKLYFNSIKTSSEEMIKKYQKTFDETIDSDTKDEKTCQGIITKSLMDNGSILQILYQMSI